MGYPLAVVRLEGPYLEGSPSVTVLVRLLYCHLAKCRAHSDDDICILNLP